jgi:hypothetical protein
LLNLKRGLFAVLVLATIGAALAYQNCDGTRSRSVDYHISMNEVDAQLNAFDKAVGGPNASTTAKASADQFVAVHNNDTSEIYYGCAPCGMGTIDQALPIDFGALNPTASPVEPSKIIVFVVVDHDAQGNWTGNVILTGNTSTAGSSQAPSGDAAPTTKSSLNVFSRKGSGIVASQGVTQNSSSTDTTVAPSGYTFDFGFIGLGSSNAGGNGGGSSILAAAEQSGQIIDGELRIPVTIGGSVNAILSTHDIEDGELSGSVVQFKIFVLSANGGDAEVGTLNMVAPE